MRRMKKMMKKMLKRKKYVKKVQISRYLNRDFWYLKDIIRVDTSASKTKHELEPVAAGRSTDSSHLYEFLNDLFKNQNIKDSTHELFLFLDNIFS